MTFREHNYKSTIPNVFTFLNLFFGFQAILMAAKGNYNHAAWLILGASLFDGLDGATARFLKAGSKFGIQFDSIADLVSFCTAPAVLVYFAYASDLPHFIAISICFIPLMAGAFRLARFNVQSEEGPNQIFMGLPTTVSAIAIASYVIFNNILFGNAGNPLTAFPLILILSFLMVSHIRYVKFPQIGRGWHHRVRAVIIIICLSCLTILKSLILFPLVTLYVLGGIISTILHNEIREPIPETRRAVKGSSRINRFRFRKH